MHPQMDVLSVFEWGGSQLMPTMCPIGHIVGVGVSSTVSPMEWEIFTFGFHQNECEFQQFLMSFPTICVRVNTIKSIDLSYNFSF